MPGPPRVRGPGVGTKAAKVGSGDGRRLPVPAA